jgi:mRNA-degrading endonuclease RelE of RelBE toxin-antitoxin system
MAMTYRIGYSPQSMAHLKGFNARDRRIIADAIDDQLSHQPGIPTRNRKPMRDNQLAEWELRVGDFRV